MKRSSIVGPLILIGLGLLFLMRNVMPDFRIMDILAVYWPWLLIAWGTLRAVEIVIWFNRESLTRRSGIGGGEWTLIVFVCLIGSGLFFAHNSDFLRNNRIAIAGWDLMGESYDYSVTGTFPNAGKTPRLLIDNSRGDARITGVDSEEIRVTGTKTIRALSRDEADKEDKLTPFEIVRSGDQIVIRTNTERSSRSGRTKATLEILVPKGAMVECRGKYGDFDVEDVTGNVDVNSDNAGVRLNNLGGNVRVDLRRSDIVRAINVKGSVEVKGRGEDVILENISGPSNVNGQYSGDLKFHNLEKPFRFESQLTELRVEKVEGDLEMVLGRLTGRRLTGPIQVRAKSKDIELTEYTGTVDMDLERGDIRLRPALLPLQKHAVRTRSGEVEFSMPAAARFDIKGEVKRGSIDNEFGAPIRVSEDGRAASVEGANGGAEIRIEVDRGEIRIRKANGVDSVPTPPVAPNPPAPKVPAPPPPIGEVTRQ